MQYIPYIDKHSVNDDDYVSEIECIYANDSHTDVFMKSLLDFRRNNSKNLIVGHLNINSLQYKFTEIEYMMSENTCDVLFLSETKVNDSHPSSQFSIENFSKPIRADKSANSGGLMAYIRNDIAHRRRPDIEQFTINPIECLAVEIMVRKEKWLMLCIYNPYNRHKDIFCSVLENIFNVFINKFHVIYVIGDCNINSSCPKDSKKLNDIMVQYSFKNIVKGPTCFKSEKGTSIDVIYTNHPRRLSSNFNICTGLSDFHNLVGFSTKMQVPRPKLSHIVYRSYKSFDEELYKRDVSYAPFHVSEIFDDVDDVYWFNECLLSGIVNEHAPL